MEKIQNAQAVKPIAEKATEKSAEFKAKKAEAAKRFAERQKERKEAGQKHSAWIIANDKSFTSFPQEVKDWLNGLANPVKAAGFGGASFFTKVFGDSPKVGDSITVMQYMSKTFQAKAKLDKAVKDWAEKGIIVEFKEDKSDGTKSTYTIVKM